MITFIFTDMLPEGVVEPHVYNHMVSKRRKNLKLQYTEDSREL